MKSFISTNISATVLQVCKKKAFKKESYEFLVINKTSMITAKTMQTFCNTASYLYKWPAIRVFAAHQ